jgi:hypothetical protein
VTVTGYKAPTGNRLHRPLNMRFGTTTILRTYCGYDLPRDGSWREDATGDEYTCQHCQAVYTTEQNSRAPWGDGEPHRYSRRRHPGLYAFLTDHLDGFKRGAHWRLLATPRPSFRTSRDARSPRDRPWRLCVGDDYARAVGYFKTTTEAVDFTKQVEAAGLLAKMLQQVDTDTWDERTSALTFLDSATPKETNPA